MPLLLAVSTLLFFLHIPASYAVTDTILPGQALAVDDKLISKDGRYALGFFETSRSKSSQDTTNWYLGIWFNTVPKFTSAWVANRDKPIKNTTKLELTISQDGNLVILNQYTKSIIWSTQENTAGNSTIAVLLSSGNLILRDSSNSSEVLWQSFDHPTDTLFPGAKLGWDKVTDLNRRLVSWKSLIDPATGAYCDELDPSGLNQFLLKPLNSSTSYWSTGVWNGKYFPSIPEMASSNMASNITIFVDNDQEKYMISNITDNNMITHHVLDVSGQSKTFVWSEGSLDWTMVYAQPKSQCDVYAVCGPFTICTDNMVPHCKCMEGFTITAPEDWELEDRTSGCSRNTPLDCISNKSITHTTDKFYPVSCVKLPQNAPKVEAAVSLSECAQVCLNSCSCTAYSFSDGGCSIQNMGQRQQQFLPEAGKMATIPITGEGTVWGDRLSATRRRGAVSIPTSPPGLQGVNKSWQSGTSRKRWDAFPGSLCFVNGGGHGQGESPLQEMDLQAASRVRGSPADGWIARLWEARWKLAIGRCDPTWSRSPAVGAGAADRRGKAGGWG